MINKKTIAKLYVKYIIKNPVIYFCYIAFGIIILLWLSQSIKITYIEKFQANIIQSDNYYIVQTNALENHNDIEYLYVYLDENTSTQKINNIVIKNNEIHVYDVEVFEYLNLLSNHKEVTIEIPIGKISLLKKIFFKGGS